MLNDLGEHFFEAFHNDGLGFTEGHLIGNLKDVTEGFSAFAIQAAHSQAELVDGLDDRVDLLGKHESGQVQHGTHADAGAEIGRARGEVAKFVIEGVVQLALEYRI